MRVLALILLFLAPMALAGQRVASEGDDEVRIFDTPCVSMETIARIPEANREGWGKVQGRVQGQRFFGCWRALGEAIYILWEDGDQGIMPLQEFHPAPEA
jgi:hypothetical protein